ncbi:Fe-S oxidoreductase [Micromonospora phaseoli]|uniref:Fe-S oxidoreductase n=1 Tax=Micromonospora phaseoli TaxID=1144548 RepID=A0A1H7BPV9_9ACTN|nr:(Fe-S)-binding protein [Micromonospora phaseoli]PZV94989.1 Fe-S oxidoreductase [Micromonospora phaseoli]GIJ79865.1 Fe-S oxidoreductase [Micromonospora phaseoli]SEJ76330.1 Fe-S oxidoreductase [Micromonospora phaseoli]
MGSVQIVTTILAAAITAVAVWLAVRAVSKMVAVIRLGQPDPTRFGEKTSRATTMLAETAGHTRMLRWSVVGAAHWFVMVGFVVLSLLVLEAYFEVVSATGGLPLIGGWALYGLVTEWIGILGVVAIVVLIAIRLANRPNRAGRRSRFTGSTMWQGYFVEAVVLAVLIMGFVIRGFKVATDHFEYPTWATPLSHAVGSMLPGWESAVSIAALIKISISMTWVIVISLNVTMGVAWHRFLAFPNIFFKRQPASAGSGLGALRPMMSNGKPLDFEEADPEKDQFGVAHVEQFTWKGLLDFSTCTECGRCQSQCPAWNTGKPLSPKLLVLSLRDHAYAKAPYLLAGGGKDLTGEEKATAAQLAHVDVLALAEAEKPLIGDAESGGVIDPDVLWSCTTCGACVEQCPVDIEHVDHIVDMRRYQVLIESNFPAEAGVMLRNLENKGNPWGAPQNTREDWTKGLDFEVPRVGEVEDFEYLFWVGCAGAFEDRAKKTTRAVATLLNEAGVSFAILGEGETCSGDPARRIGNEFVFQMLAQQNVETLNEAFEGREQSKKKIVATCPHCFNTLGNEYGQLGGEFEVVHHTQLLAHLVSTGKLTPVQPVDGGVTYHDPCYLGRHNRVFAAPREVLGDSIKGDLVEMPRNSERSFCCGAGGARMWMEERIGKRVNVDRVEEAMSTGAKTVAVGCPFCSTMLNDGVNGKGAGEQVEVVDVASVLLRSVRPEQAPGTGEQTPVAG